MNILGADPGIRGGLAIDIGRCERRCAAAH